MKLTLYEQSSVFDELKAEWNDLLERSTCNHIFCTWEWQSLWWTTFEPGQLWIVVARDETDRLLGIAPWFILNDAAQGRLVCSIGCEDVTDYLDVIVDADCIDPVLDQFAQFLAQNRDAYDSLDYCNIPEDSPTTTRFPYFLQQYGFDVTLEQQDVCPIIRLPDDWEVFLSGMNKKYRHEIRRKLRRTEGAPETVNWYVVDPSHDLTVEIERFLGLMANSDPQKHAFLQDDKNVAFFKTLIPVLFARGWVQLSFLTVNDEVAATYLNFDYGNHILVYNSGLNPETYGHLSPGIVLLAYLIMDAIDKGRDVFDFLRGDEVYKYRMGGVDTRVMNLRARL